MAFVRMYRIRAFRVGGRTEQHADPALIRQHPLDVSTTLTGNELIEARTPKGYTAINQEAKWVEFTATEGFEPNNYRMISRERYSATFKDTVGAGASYTAPAVVVQFPGSTTNNVWIDGEFNNAEYEGQHKNEQFGS